ncbi:hypothetical protein HHL19_14525 [Streptomyces sp. R302]|uniref:hypothetical protein n=1 Tax=unclassified Streptomyces TaxID=2593676 RepID=UPI00145CBDDE|nr:MULTISPECIES: hypothetical protein [unclassified Streptomyces]NML51286.1 hypothetical protein [Streptomyces sp. R301]NML79864.1 hypothetical protein [Streptomyces sp. R302]
MTPPAPTRLVTHVELDEARTDDRRLSVSARLEAELSDGRALVLLDDRGWSESVLGDADIRTLLTRASVEDDARTVVGPDEPYGDETQEQAAAGHWAALAGILARQGVHADPTALAGLAHDVVLGERLRAWAGF